jgi:hypothetical protein
VRTFRATTLLCLKASVWFFCPNNYLITHCIACINFNGFLLRMTSLFLTIILNLVLINIDGRYCLVCSTGLVLINMVILYALCSFMLFYCKISFVMLNGTWRTTQENSTTTRTKRALVLAN